MDFDDPYRPAGTRRERVTALMAGLRLDTEPEHPDIAARRQREAADRLLRHDARFNLEPGPVAAAIRLGIRYVAGDDPAARDD